MKKEIRIGRVLLCLIISLMMIMTLIPRMPSVMAYAEDGEQTQTNVPDHTKYRKDNGDGTYTIALDVKGDTTEGSVKKANVVVVLDTSGSMNENTGNTTTTYRKVSQQEAYWYWEVYGLVDNEYVQLEQEFHWSDYSITYSYNGEPYTDYDNLYVRGRTENETRLQAAKKAVNELATELLKNNGGDNPSDTVQMALVSFGTHATDPKGPATDAATFAGYVDGLTANGGTNWETALAAAQNVAFGDEDTTYVIFVSDGNPTFRDTSLGYEDYNGRYGVYGSGQERSENVSRSYTAAKAEADELIGAGYKLYTIGVYGNVDRMEGLGGEGYYAASDTAALNEALADIIEKIEEGGIGEVAITDGTTSKVSAESDVSLLEVDENSYKYYRSGGADNKYGTSDPENGNYGTPWTEEQGAPKAEFKDGKVVWNLEEVGVLEDDVTYTVTFDCYPSQTALDYKARLDNGEKYEDIVPAEARDYFKADGSLATNTTATLSYDDTRTPEEEEPVDFNTLSSITTKASTMTVEKKWDGDSAPEGTALEMDVMMDDGEEPFETVELKGPSWNADIHISYGIIKNGNALKGAEGHDFSFAELPSVQYQWELQAPVVHPMIINGTETILIKVDEEKGYKPEGEAATYTINGEQYYVDQSITSLQAVNHRRSNLNLSKVVKGNAPEGVTFPFTLTVNNSKAENGSADDTNSDYYVWFSVKNGDEYVERETDATKSVDEKTGRVYYYAESGKPISVKLQDGDNLRFTNLPTGTTYEFKEGETEGFSFVEAKSINKDDQSIKPGQTTTGKIETYDAVAYGVEYTNEYVEPEPTSYDPPVLKIVKGEGANPDDEFTFELKAVYAPDGVEEKPMPEGSKGDVKEMKAKAGVESEFGDIVFTVPGIYSYVISEKNTGLKGYTYDKAIYTVTFDVKVGDNNILVATREVKKDGKVCEEEVSKFEFTNIYEAEKPVKTGDATIIVPYIVIGISALVLLAMLLFRKKAKEQ